MSSYFKVSYTGKANTTVEEYVKDSNHKVWNLTANEFLLVKDENGERNLDKIYNSYSSTLKSQYYEEYVNEALFVIVPNTNLILPKSNAALDEIELTGDNQFVEYKSSPGYWADNYVAMTNNDGFVKSEQLTLQGRSIDAQIINENCRIWIWIRSLDKIANISPFISNLNTSKSSGSGSFNIILDPILDLDSIIFSGSNTLNLFNLTNPDGTQVMDLFSKKIQQNDVIFIRFEKLNLENELDLDLDSLKDQFEINKSSLSGSSEDPFTRNWDMIGLIDSVRSSYSSQSSDRFINLTGRDLTKLIIEDASYFIPIKFKEQGDKQWIYGGDKSDSWVKRNGFSGNYDYIFSSYIKDIKGTIGFVINHLSNLGIVPNELFSSYGNKISKRKIVSGTEEMVDKNVNGIWQIIKIYIDPAVDDRRINDNSFLNPDGTLFEFFNKVCQQPFVEFWGDTNGDTFDFVARQPPLTKKAIQDVVQRGENAGYIVIENKDLFSYDLDFDDRFYASYKLEAGNAVFGVDSDSLLSYLPVIYFNKIAETFGNRRMVVSDSYISMKSLTGKNSDLNLNLFIQNLLPDFMFIIDSNHYLPFTRKGTINISGDRRIKVGTFIKLNSTNELFYVTAVSHSLSINKSKVDRTTTLTVERGMVFKYILGTTEQGIVESVNYFDIVDLGLIYDTITTNNNLLSGGTQQTNTTIKTKFALNENLFNFFLNRKQFD